MQTNWPMTHRYFQATLSGFDPFLSIPNMSQKGPFWDSSTMEIRARDPLANPLFLSQINTGCGMVPWFVPLRYSLHHLQFSNLIGSEAERCRRLSWCQFEVERISLAPFAARGWTLRTGFALVWGRVCRPDLRKNWNSHRPARMDRRAEPGDGHNFLWVENALRTL